MIQETTTAVPAGNAAKLRFLHYGGSLNRAGKLGQKPVKGAQFKARRRLENICRLENAGFTISQIAPMLVISTNRLSHIMKSPEYLSVRIAITHGIVVDGEAQLALIKEQRKEMLTQLLPPALQVIANELQRSSTTIAERKHKVAVAQDLMDREGTFAKVSRTEIKPVDLFDFESADNASHSLISKIKQSAHPGSIAPATLQAAVSYHNEFSNCQTIDTASQQEALRILEAQTDERTASE